MPSLIALLPQTTMAKNARDRTRLGRRDGIALPLAKSAERMYTKVIATLVMSRGGMRGRDQGMRRGPIS